MISSDSMPEFNRGEALRFALEVVKSQPCLPSYTEGGTLAGEYIVAIADVFVEYVTGKPSQPGR